MAWYNDLYDRLSCKIIGWNYDVMKQCGEASYRTKNKYMSALVIVSIIWSVIGYNFASKYLDVKSVIACLAVAFVFVMIVVSIERIIIMKQGDNRFILLFRVFIAFCMATLGSFIFDQILFSTDLEAQIQRNREDEIKRTVALRMEECEKDIAKLMHERDSLARANTVLYERLKDNPTIETTSVSSHQVVAGQDPQGKPIIRNMTDVVKNHVANPLSKQVDDNNNALKGIEKKMGGLYARKMAMEDDVRKEIKERKYGFMEDLAASVDVVFQNWITILVYVLLFLFMIALECFVVSISFKEDKCEYDLIVEHQLRVKKMEIENSFRILSEKFITNNMEEDRQG